MQLNEKIERLREKRGISVRELARQLGEVSDTTVGRWISGSSEPRFTEAVRLASFFGVPLAYLAGGPPSAPSSWVRVGDKLYDLDKVTHIEPVVSRSVVADGMNDVPPSLRKVRIHFGGGVSVESSSDVVLEFYRRLIRFSRSLDDLLEENRPLTGGRWMTSADVIDDSEWTSGANPGEG